MKENVNFFTSSMPNDIISQEKIIKPTYNKDKNYLLVKSISQIANRDELKNIFQEIKAVNSSLLDQQISCLIISVEKNKKEHIKKLHEAICEMRIIEGIKMILYVEHTVDPNDLPVALWRFCNNLDPKRDHFIVKKQVLQNPNQYVACIGFDGTLKTKQFDDFYRDWPNIIIADDKTIAAVDEKWERLGSGKFIPSPSLKFKGQMYGEEAVVNLPD